MRRGKEKIGNMSILEHYPDNLHAIYRGLGGGVVRYRGSRVHLASDFTSSKGQKRPDISYMLHCL